MCYVILITFTFIVCQQIFSVVQSEMVINKFLKIVFHIIASRKPLRITSTAFKYRYFL